MVLVVLGLDFVFDNERGRPWEGSCWICRRRGFLHCLALGEGVFG